MYKLDYKNAKKARNFGIPILFLAILFSIILATIIFSSLYKKSKMDSKITAYSVTLSEYTSTEDHHTYYRPTYYYTVNGKNYTYEPNYSSSSSNIKNNKIIYYDSQNPSYCISDAEITLRPTYAIAILFFILFMVVGINEIKKGQNLMCKMKWLEENGTLVRNLNYKLIDSGYKVNNNRVKKIQIEFELPNGEMVTLEGEPRFDFKSNDEDGMVDLLIDPNNPENYYIDFNIEEI